MHMCIQKYSWTASVADMQEAMVIAYSETAEIYPITNDPTLTKGFRHPLYDFFLSLSQAPSVCEE